MHAYVKQHLEAYLHANISQYTIHVECCLLTLLLDDNGARIGELINLSMLDIDALIQDRQTIVNTKTIPKPLCVSYVMANKLRAFLAKKCLSLDDKLIQFDYFALRWAKIRIFEELFDVEKP
ncbi:hypothetical protein PR048_012585 [Dryococelus australis]|uniref:Tyr recombinase domain-containing protein n=1 Tax=Dryococelus australis TaxID=614101 RepID=A0ABQ9HQI0_9NEOP|nr:hypothetical protein PR048_012585 [Dryococelus australis]